MNLTDFLDENGIEYRRNGEHENVGDGWVGVCCPKCGEQNFKLGISLTSMKGNCWQCGPVSAAWALSALASRKYGEVRDALGLMDRAVRVPRAAGKLVMPAGLCDLTPAHKDYLAGRGFDPARLQRTWKIQATAQHSEIPWHVVIPVHQRREVVSWTARRVNDRGRRYFTAPDERSLVPIKRTLYGADLAGNSVVVVEGPVDVWKVGPGAVCLYGLGHTDAQVLLLTRYAKRVIVLDSEPAAQVKARALARLLAVYPGETVLVTLDSEDAGSATPKEVELLRRELS